MKDAAYIADATAEWIRQTYGVSALVVNLTQDEAGHVIEIRIGTPVKSLMERTEPARLGPCD